jgi:cell division protein FtsI/penicillin-binding protein 2
MGRRYPGTSVIGRIRHLLSERTSGYDVITSIDLNLQRIVEQALANRKGAAIVMEVKTGRILAIASVPGFNPEELSIPNGTRSLVMSTALYIIGP